MYANSEGSGETARMRRLAWAFAGRLCDKHHNLMRWFILFKTIQIELIDPKGRENTICSMRNSWLEIATFGEEGADRILAVLYVHI